MKLTLSITTVLLIFYIYLSRTSELEHVYTRPKTFKGNKDTIYPLDVKLKPWEVNAKH